MTPIGLRTLFSTAWARHRSVRALFVAGSATLGVAGGQMLSETATHRASVAEVRASVDRGSVFRLYYNNMWSEPQAAAIQPGRWTVYRFPVPSRLTALRLDPSDAVGAEVLVKDVTIRSSGSSMSLTADQLEHWLTQNLEVTHDASAGATRVTIRQPGAYMMGTVDIDVTHKTARLLSHFRLNFITLLWCALLLGMGLLLLSARLHDLPILLAMTAIAVVSVSATHYISPRALAWPAADADVSVTVGHQSFSGTPKTPELRALNVALGSGMTLALALGWLLRRRATGEGSVLISESRHLNRWDVLFLAGCVLVFAIGSVPPALEMQRVALNARHALDVDSITVLSWQYLYSRGALPWKDFWFPYSGMYDQLAPLYPELTMRWGHTLGLFAVMVTSTFFVTGRSRVAVIALCGIWLYLQAMGIIVAIASLRYFLSVGLVVLSAVAVTERSVWAAAVFGLWSGYVFQEEVSQVVYAAPGVALIAGAALLRPYRQSRSAVASNLAVAAGAFGLVLAALLLSLIRQGQFGQWWEFVSTVDLMSNYSGWPADVVSWFSLPATVDQFLVFVTVVLLVAGLLQAVWTRFSDVYLLVPAAVGFVSVMLLQKQVIRPGIAGQILAVPILGLALLIVQRLRLRPAVGRYASWTAFSTALIVTCFTWSIGPNRDRVASYLDVTTGLLPDLEYSVLAGEEWAAARAAYFSPSSMTISELPGDEFASRARQLTEMAASDNVFVLGDNSDIYIALRRPSAFYPNLYNQSPLFCQRHTMEWLHEYNPKFLFWDPQEKAFDGVPNPVRVPLLYNYAVAQFVPHGTLGKFEVLRRRMTGELPDLDYWRGRLGDSLDLGYIPAASRVLAEIDDEGAHQMPYLIARVAAPVDGAVYSVFLRLAGKPYTVRFKGRTCVTEYPIALERLPLAAAASALGLAPVVMSAQDVSVSAEIRTLRLRAERLY